VLSAQVEDIPIRRQKYLPQTKQLHYIVKSDTGQHYELAFDQDQADWLLIKTVDDAWIGSR